MPGEVAKVCVTSDDVRVIQPAGRPGLALQSAPLDAVTRIAMQHLDRDVPRQAGIAGAIDLAHPTRSDQSENFVGTETTSSGERHNRRW